MIFVEWNHINEYYEVTQDGGMGILTTRQNRDAAIKAARRYAERGEDVVVKGPRMNRFKDV